MTKALRASQVIVAASLAAFASSGAAYANEQTFVAVIKNVTADDTLKLPRWKSVESANRSWRLCRHKRWLRAVDPGKPAGESGLEALAEDGNAEALVGTLKGLKGVRAAGMFIPGQSFEVIAEPGDRLVFASMFVQSNDKFYAPDPNGIALFDSMSAPVSGDWTRA